MHGLADTIRSAVADALSGTAERVRAQLDVDGTPPGTLARGFVDLHIAWADALDSLARLLRRR